jgi:dCMP deaminase
MSRPSFHDIYMRLAFLMSERSTCERANAEGIRFGVGCAIVSTDFRRVFSVGYNGNASGLPNGCDSNEPGKCGCIHAETNAIVSCSADRDEPKVVFCTTLPCVACAKLIIQLGGVQEVYYRNDYRLKDSLMLFTHEKVNISVGHLLEGDSKDQAQVRAAEATTAWQTQVTKGMVRACL